jgi:hypothetical protein
VFFTFGDQAAVNSLSAWFLQRVAADKAGIWSALRMLARPPEMVRFPNIPLSRLNGAMPTKGDLLAI